MISKDKLGPERDGEIVGVNDAERSGDGVRAVSESVISDVYVGCVSA